MKADNLRAQNGRVIGGVDSSDRMLDVSRFSLLRASLSTLSALRLPVSVLSAIPLDPNFLFTSLPLWRLL